MKYHCHRERAFSREGKRSAARGGWRSVTNFTVFFVLLFAAPQPTLASDPMVEKLANKELPPLEEPNIQIKTLGNGIKVYYLRDTELPVFHLRSYFEMGKLYEDKDTRGITGFFMSAWRSGGSQKYTPDQIDDELEFVRASLSSDADSELSSLSMKCLMEDAAKILTIYFDVMRHPEFNADRLETIRKNTLNNIKRRNEEGMNIALREFVQSLYGEDSPHAWLSTPETINAIKREGLKKYHEDHIAPSVMYIAASSPMTFDKFLDTISPHLKGWEKKLPHKKLEFTVQKQWERGLEFIQKEDNQSALVLGHFGERRFNKDKYKIILADEILGGSTFGSKLGDRIRSDLGLVYSIRSSFGFGTDYAPFSIATLTKSESTVQTLREVEKVFADTVLNENISESELEEARERIINRLIFEYDIPFNMVTMRLTYDYFGYPPGYLKIFQKEIQSVKLAEVKSILKDYFFPQRLKIMIVGDRTRIADLSSLSELVERPLDEE